MAPPAPPPSLPDAFATGTLVRPSHARANLVHVVRAVVGLAGVPDMVEQGPTRDIADLIGPTDHLIFILLDGLGMSTVRRLPHDSFVRRTLAREITATCPSTTAAALTCVATAQYPNRHAVTGWFTYLPDRGLTIAPLPFVDRFAPQPPLVLRGLTVEAVLPVPPVLPRMTRAALTVVPSAIGNTAYNTFTRGGTTGKGYVSVAHAVDVISDFVRNCPVPTYTHLYLPEVDTVCHKRGVDDPAVVALVMEIDRELARLADEVRGKARVVLTADHGLIDVPRADQTLLVDGDPLLELLIVPPTGDARMPIFHVRPGRHDALREQFVARFGDRMILAPIAEVERLELLGPGPLSGTARARFGDFIAFPFRPATLGYHPPGKPPGDLFKAVHAGLSPQEMEIPLCVA